jgi:predicted Zn-dependent protease with MMP-like domain
MLGDDRTRDERLEEAWQALEDGEVDLALALARGLLTTYDSDPEILYLAGSSLMEAELPTEAEHYLNRALSSHPAHNDARAALSQLLFDTCRFSEARTQVEQLLDADPEDARAHHLASLLAERRGEYARSEEEERMAHRLAPEAFPLPPRFTQEEFDSYVEEAVAALPEEFRESMHNLAVVVEDVPGTSLLNSLESPTPVILGLFVGTPLPDQSLAELPRAPDAIYLFKRNLERICESRPELVEEIKITLLHEVGHFMGLDDNQIGERGFG